MVDLIDFEDFIEVGERLVFDIETNGFRADEIFCIGVHNIDSNTYQSYIGDDVADAIVRLAEADLVIGHYIKGFDLKVISKLTEGMIVIDPAKVIDTVEMSRRLFPDMPNHKLESWGKILGYPKMAWTDFEKFDPGMVPYMDRDVEINVKLYEFLTLVERDNLREA